MPKGQRRILALGVFLLLSLPLAGCGGGNDLILGATTSLQDTGLLDELVSAFEKESGYDISGVTPLVAGSGQVLALARRGEIDVLITHSPAAEEEFLAEGHGIDRRPLMENLFIIAGPADDRAAVGAALTPAEAFRRIAEGSYAFVSRGDGSGTHARELAIWQEAGIDPRGQRWYQESATGQGQNLLFASDKGAYTLVDSATFAVFGDRTDLVPHVFEGEMARNRYSVIRVNPENHSDLNVEAALAFADFVTSPQGQLIIQEFGREEYGESLFIPASADAGTRAIAGTGALSR
ncbi:MAG: substrate-binding domain-containing protein [Chloroflexi bacterium]|nr:substrate-binding domain-containing protein [Chloroflexota bacterium]